MTNPLGGCLRSWRERLSPAEVDLPERTGRRTPGLRREDVAAQAQISVNYLTRLEQGRVDAPSASVIGSLARALRLNSTETAHLFTLAGHANSAARIAARHLTPSVRRILDRFHDVPVIVIDPAWNIVEANRMAELMIFDDLVGDNAARREFLGPQWVSRDEDERAAFRRDIVADLAVQLASHPDDPALTSVIDDLQSKSAEFATLWAKPPTTRAASSRKTFRHELVGEITVDCDHLDVVGTDLSLVLWTAVPGSKDADALKLLSVVGRQRISTSVHADAAR